MSVRESKIEKRKTFPHHNHHHRYRSSIVNLFSSAAVDPLFLSPSVWDIIIKILQDVCVSLSLSWWGNHSVCTHCDARALAHMNWLRVKLSSSSCGDKTMFRYLLFLSSQLLRAHTRCWHYLCLLSWDENWFLTIIFFSENLARCKKISERFFEFLTEKFILNFKNNFTFKIDS